MGMNGASFGVGHRGRAGGCKARKSVRKLVPKPLDVTANSRYNIVMDTKQKKLTIRLPERLLNQMAEVAKENNRSLNGEVLQALSEHVKRQQKKS